MNLPTPPAKYDRVIELERNRQIEELARNALLRNQNIEHDTTGSGGRKARYILSSPDGTRYAIVVDNAGVLSTEAV